MLFLSDIPSVIFLKKGTPGYQPIVDFLAEIADAPRVQPEAESS